MVAKLTALWYVVLGPSHDLVRKLIRYQKGLVSKERQRERVTPTKPEERKLVPFHLARRLQIDMNVWFRAQARSVANTPVPDVCAVFVEIEYEQNWSRRLPQKYIKEKKVSDTPGGGGGQGLTDDLSLSTLLSALTGTTLDTSGASSQGNPQGDRTRSTASTRQEPVRHPNYDQERFQAFKDAAG